MTENTIENKIAILAELWINYRNDENFEDFIAYNDVGLPLAYLLDNDIVKGTEIANKFISETYNLLLASLEVEDSQDYQTLDDIFMSAPR